MKNDLRIKKEFEDFAKTVTNSLYSLKNLMLLSLSLTVISGIGKATYLAQKIQYTRVGCSKLIFSSLPSTPISPPK